MILIIMISIFIISIFSILISLGIWTYNDAKSRGLNPVLWTVVVILGQNLIGLILYFVIGRKEERIVCENCHTSIIKSSKYCGRCGIQISNKQIPSVTKNKKYLVGLFSCITIFVLSSIGILCYIVFSDDIPVVDGVSVGMVQNNYGNKWELSFKSSGDELEKSIKIEKGSPKNLYVNGKCDDGMLTLYIFKDGIVEAYDMTTQTEELKIDLSKYGEGKLYLQLGNNNAKNAEFKAYWE